MGYSDTPVIGLQGGAFAGHSDGRLVISDVAGQPSEPIIYAEDDKM